MAETYTKLFNTIVTSTIWQEDKDTKILWITMLAIKDAEGYVAGSIPGIANLAGLSIGETKVALDKLMAPDPYSRTKDNEGRRIAEADGGWIVLNHYKYREIRDPEKRKEQNREAQRRYREKSKQKVSDVSQCKPESAHTDTYTDTYTKKTPIPTTGESLFDEFWKTYPKKVGKGAALNAFKKLKVTDEFLNRMLSAVESQRKTEQWRKDGGQFIPHPATWLNQGRWDDEVDDPDTVEFSKEMDLEEAERLLA